MINKNSGFSNKIKENDIIEYFNKYSKVFKCIIYDDCSEGFLIIKEQNKILQIISNQPHLIKGENIFCYESKEKINFNNKNENFNNNTMIIEGIPIEANKKDLIKYFKRYGDIEDVIINSKKKNFEKTNSGFIIFKSPLSVNLCLKDKINHLILGRYILCKKYKERNNNKSKIFSEKHFYSLYDSNSQKLKIKNKYNNKNNLRNFNDIYYYNNFFEEPTNLNPIQIQKSNLFIYRKETNNKSDNDKIIHENNNNVNIFKNDSLNQSSSNFNLLFKQNFKESDFQQEDNHSKKTEKILLKENETFNYNNHLHLLYSNLINKKSFNKNNDNKYEKENNKNDSQLFQNLFNNYLKNPKKNENNHYKLYDVNGEEISKLSLYQNITKVSLFKSDSDKSEKDSNSDSNKSINQKLNISNKLNLNNSNNIKSLSTYSISKNCSNNNSNNNSNSNLNCSDYYSIKISGFNSDNQSSKFSNISCNDLCLKHSKSFNNFFKKKKFQKFKKSKSAVFKNIEILLLKFK